MSKSIEELSKQFLGETRSGLKDLSEIESKIVPNIPRRESGTYNSRTEVDLATVEVIPEYEFCLQSLKSPECPPLFVTGEAGTGKSTFIHWLVDKLDSCAIVAPTSIAAINVNGATIHSLFSLPIGHIDPDDDFNLSQKNRIVIENLKYLIVDEVSMVAANFIDVIDKQLKTVLDSRKPFGGVKIIFVGDLYQLPPIVESNEERAYFGHRYLTPYFFSADVFKTVKIFPVQLKQVRRQTDGEFKHALSKIRVARDHRDSLAFLNRECFREKESILTDSVCLVPTNAKARAINMQRLNELEGSAEIYDAVVTGRIPANKWHIAIPDKLHLKVGAKVVFMKNNTPNWINGSSGVVIELHQDHVKVKLQESDVIVTVEPETWEKVEYTYNYQTKKLEKNVVATFTQLPLTLGWAITIHKSQGMTLDPVSIDIGNQAFENGQCYVALSRAKSMDGLKLMSPLHMSDIKTSPEINIFYQQLFE